MSPKDCSQNPSPSRRFFRRLKKPRPLLLGSACLALIFPTPSTALDDFGTWQWTSIELYKQGNFSTTLFNELRWKDTSTDFSLALVGPMFRYSPWTHTSFGLGAYYLHVPRGFNLDDTNQAWLDIDMLNTWQATEDLSLSLRTMFENRWLEDPHGHRQISRHRAGVSWKIKDAGWLTRIYANNELFLDWDSGAVRENRAIPLALSFKMGDSANLDLFPMLRSSYSPSRDDWTHEFIIGTHLVWRPW